MSMYVMSDIHGHYDEFLSMLALIDFKDSDTLLLLGDNIDRGRDSLKMLEYIRDHDNVESLMGNHELELLTTLDDPSYDNWLRQGGHNTLRELRSKGAAYFDSLVAMIRGWSYYKIINDRFICVHAGYREEYTPYDMVWVREEFYYVGGVADFKTVVGHTPTTFLTRKSSILHYGDTIINIDCGVAYRGRLSCLRLDDLAEFYVDRQI